MKLFELNRITYDVELSAEVVLLKPFKDIIDRDKSRSKDIAKKELALIYHLCDTRSDYVSYKNEYKLKSIIENLQLPVEYRIDSVMESAIAFYKSFKTPLEQLYEGALIASNAIDTYLRGTEELLAERYMGKVVTDISKITSSIEKLPKIMMNLKAAEKELIKEKKDTEGKMKGSQMMNLYEEGI